MTWWFVAYVAVCSGGTAVALLLRERRARRRDRDAGRELRHLTNGKHEGFA